MSVLLETDRLVLREFTGADAPLLVELDGDPEVMRFISHGVATPADHIRDVVLPRWLGFYAKGEGFGYWAALERPSLDFAGWFHLRPDEHHPERAVDLGYRLRRDAWGRGLATEGGRAMLAYGFQTLALERITAHAMRGNEASIRVMEKLGMRCEGPFTHPLGPECVRYVLEAPGTRSGG